MHATVGCVEGYTILLLLIFKFVYTLALVPPIISCFSVSSELIVIAIDDKCCQCKQMCHISILQCLYNVTKWCHWHSISCLYPICYHFAVWGKAEKIHSPGRVYNPSGHLYAHTSIDSKVN